MVEWDLPINPISGPLYLQLPASETLAFTSSVYCKGTVHAAKRLQFTARRSFPELSKAALVPLCYVRAATLRVRDGSQPPNLTADIYHLGRVHRLATWLVRGLRQVPYEERPHQRNLFSLERMRHRANF